MDERCENCKFWKKLADAFQDTNSGCCRRNPPVSCVSSGYTYRNQRDCDREVVVRGDVSHMFPVTAGYDWCGEWREGGDA